uniref:Uncharacterized protein n=1 Tax=Romanomermis culicivorax TaxID=13658 RepID=A0A915I2A0_ROMCU
MGFVATLNIVFLSILYIQSIVIQMSSTKCLKILCISYLL